MVLDVVVVVVVVAVVMVMVAAGIWRAARFWIATQAEAEVGRESERE